MNNINNIDRNCHVNNRVDLAIPKPKNSGRFSSSYKPSWLKRLATAAGYAFLLFNQPTAVLGLRLQPRCALPDIFRPFGLNPICQLDDIIHPYVEAAGVVAQDSLQGYEKLPERLSEFMNNGLYLIEVGERACSLMQKPLSFPICDRVSKLMELEVRKSPESAAEVFNEKSKDKGRQLFFNPEMVGDVYPALKLLSPKYEVWLGSNPKKLSNFRNGMQLVNEEMLQNPEFYEQADSQLENFVKRLHGVLAKGFIEEQGIPLTPGKYRTRELIIRHDDTIGEENYYDYLIERGSNEEELEAFQTGTAKMFKGKPLNDIEKAVWEKFVRFPPDAKEVPHLMREFVREWKKYGQQEIPAVALAAWVHYQIVHIHPFADGNGRLGRLLMNGVLAKGGYTPLAIHSDEVYTDAVRKEEELAGSFARFLSDDLIPWNRKNQKQLYAEYVPYDQVHKEPKKTQSTKQSQIRKTRKNG